MVDWLRKNPGGLGEEFVVRRKVQTVKKTFECDPETIQRFMDETRKRGLKVKDAVEQALRNWLEK